MAGTKWTRGAGVKNILLGLLLMLAPILRAQNSTIVASNIGDVGGNLTTGTWCVTPAQPFVRGGGGNVVPTQVCYAVTAGVLQSGGGAAGYIADEPGACLLSRAGQEPVPGIYPAAGMHAADWEHVQLRQFCAGFAAVYKLQLHGAAILVQWDAAAEHDQHYREWGQLFGEYADVQRREWRHMAWLSRCGRGLLNQHGMVYQLWHKQ